MAEPNLLCYCITCRITLIAWGSKKWMLFWIYARLVSLSIMTSYSNTIAYSRITNIYHAASNNSVRKTVVIPYSTVCTLLHAPGGGKFFKGALVRGEMSNQILTSLNLLGCCITGLGLENANLHGTSCLPTKLHCLSLPVTVMGIVLIFTTKHTYIHTQTDFGLGL